MKTGLQTDHKAFQRAMALYARATGKTEAEVLNKSQTNALINPSYGLMKNTPKADPKKIEAALKKDQIGLKIAARKLKGKGGKRWAKTVGKAMRKDLAHRKRASGYAVSGWIAAARAFGSRRSVAKKFTGNLGHGRVAAEKRLVSEATNTTEDIGKVKGAVAALYRSKMGAAKDMKVYAERKLQETANKFMR